MTQSRLKGKELPNEFWAEAVNTTIYILNRSPTKAVLNKTPFEAWHKWKPKVSYFKVFGCIAYSHIPSQIREKFDDKGEKVGSFILSKLLLFSAVREMKLMEDAYTFQGEMKLTEDASVSGKMSAATDLRREGFSGIFEV
ncbi:uncharacterized mitochondrial protein AtMg00710-like [Magnolia sinica]|uniref:uncharacterized mitochondrial protein AtMg00710-like n=1 Tax=Magnolia sinica TaxID=86752 RepID=UPI00265B4E5F|nr:uncharacterized mitochondrial protein AtMg00710-like [Magnolia sinica]